MKAKIFLIGIVFVMCFLDGCKNISSKTKLSPIQLKEKILEQFDKNYAHYFNDVDSKLFHDFLKHDEYISNPPIRIKRKKYIISYYPCININFSFATIDLNIEDSIEFVGFLSPYIFLDSGSYVHHSNSLWKSVDSGWHCQLMKNNPFFQKIDNEKDVQLRNDLIRLFYNYEEHPIGKYSSNKDEIDSNNINCQNSGKYRIFRLLDNTGYILVGDEEMESKYLCPPIVSNPFIQDFVKDTVGAGVVR